MKRRIFPQLPVLTCLLCGLLGVRCVLGAEEAAKEVLHLDFEETPDTASWKELSGQAPQIGEKWVFEEEAGNKFLRATAATGIFGITIPLQEPIFINPSIARVELRLKMRKTKGTSQLLEAGLTSRDHPETQEGRAFDRSSESVDSGFRMRGYQHNDRANILEWCIDGQLRSYTEERALCPPEVSEMGDWHEWRIVWDNEQSTLSLYVDDFADEPVLVQKGVALDGAELKSLWLNGSMAAIEREEQSSFFIDYDDVSVSAVSKERQ